MRFWGVFASKLTDANTRLLIAVSYVAKFAFTLAVVAFYYGRCLRPLGNHGSTLPIHQFERLRWIDTGLFRQRHRVHNRAKLTRTAPSVQRLQWSHHVQRDGLAQLLAGLLPDHRGNRHKRPLCEVALRFPNHRPVRRAIGKQQKRPGSIAPQPLSQLGTHVTMTKQTPRLLQVPPHQRWSPW